MGPHVFVAVDPGASGGWVIRHRDGSIASVGTYTGDGDVLQVCAFVRRCHHAGYPFAAVIEHVWASPVMGVSSAFSFGENFGAWCMAFKVVGVPVYGVLPQAWQRVVAPDLKAQGNERKRALKALAQERHPGARVTLATADALLISDYCVQAAAAGRELGPQL